MDKLSILAVVGILLIAALTAAGGVAALITQKVFVDRDGHVTEIELPLLGKLRTNYPSLVAVALGVALAYMVLNKITLKPEMIPITAKILVEHPGSEISPQVFVGVIPQAYHVVKNNVTSGTPQEVTVMVRKDDNYHVVVYTVTGIDENGRAQKVVDDGAAEQNGNFNARLRMTR
jgi:hypothetical protein